MKRAAETVLAVNPGAFEVAQQRAPRGERRKDESGTVPDFRTLDPKHSGERCMQWDGPLIVVFGRGLTNQDEGIFKLQVQIVPHEGGDLLGALSGVEHHLINEAPVTSDGEELRKLLLGKRAIGTHLLSSCLNMLDFQQRIPFEAFDLHEVIQERIQ